MRRLIGIVLSIAVVMMCSCSGSGNAPVDAAAQPVPTDGISEASGGLPGFQFLVPRTRVAQAVTNHQYTDGDMLVGSGATMTGTDLALDSAGLSWAVLSLEMADSMIPMILHLTGTTSGLYIGLSDYGTDSWKWLGPVQAPDDIPLVFGDLVNDEGWFHVALVCCDGDSAQVQLSVDMDVEIWNVMVWIAGDNNLAGAAVTDINEMESVGSTDNLNILVGFDIDPEYAPAVTGIDMVRFIRVVEDSNPGTINVTGDPANAAFPRSGYNSADPANLEQFLDWCGTNFPASHSMLILWDHGDGWLPGTGGGSGSGRSASGVLGDDSDSGDLLCANSAIAAVLDGRGLDYLCFDACNMGQVEALDDFSGTAGYIIASQMTIPNGGFPYDLWLGDWTAAYPLPHLAIGMLLCSRYANYYDTQFEDASLTMYDMVECSALTAALADLAVRATVLGDTEQAALGHAIQFAFRPEYNDGTADLGEFLVDYAAESADGEVPALATAAKTALDELVLLHESTINIGGSGSSVLLPDEYELELCADDYRPIAFNQATGWLEMLEAVGVPGSEWPTVNWEPGWQIVYEWDDPAPDIQLFIEDPGGLYGWPGEGGDLAQSILFSDDNLVSGQAREWAELRENSAWGYYLAAVNYDDFGPPGAETIDVHAWLEDGGGTPQYDFGVTSVNRGDMDVWVGFLRCVGEVSGTWEPGDYLEITWSSSLADMDLEVVDPLGVWGCPAFPECFEGLLEFSDDSYFSGEAREWIKLLAGGRTGEYTFTIYYSDFSGTMPPESMPVAVRLYDSGGTLKQDLGGVMFDGEFGIGTFENAAVLEY